MTSIDFGARIGIALAVAVLAGPALVGQRVGEQGLRTLDGRVSGRRSGRLVERGPQEQRVPELT
jgi:hypothetical protein